MFDKYRLLNLLEIALEKRVLYSYPRSLVLFMSNTCNLSCAHCQYYSKYGNTDYTNFRKYDLNDNIVDNLSEVIKHSETFVITGEGEPLLQTDMINKIMALNTNNSVLYTNGLLLNKYDFQTFKNLKRMMVSIDAPESSFYTRLRGGDLNTVKSNLENFIKQNPHVNVVPTMLIAKYSLAYVYDMYKFAKDLGVKEILLQKCIYWQELKEYEVDLNDMNYLNMFYRDIKDDLHVEFSGFNERELNVIYADGYMRRSFALHTELPSVELKRCEPSTNNDYLDFIHRIRLGDNSDDGAGKLSLDQLILMYMDELKQKENIREPYCYAPWLQMVVDPESNSRPCCSTVQHFKDPTKPNWAQQNFNITNNFRKVWNTSGFRNLRQHMFGDITKLPMICQSCNSSHRKRLSEDYIKFINMEI
jgi:MoaA/NifB/PqqE/SkfB family radical SAM enzyme